ncbi:ArsR/SmtB family transcription factor [Streptacidiphilus albus]|uniref:ArsR/SmtB family transcription factor n=2 Tax=Streptacidiphilus albus TaxID=105425 RepID=UPI00128DF9D9|nr:helix-turn-helix domain-containing protein [Streptacidiphilus albus]
MLRIDMHIGVLADTRFAISPASVTVDALHLMRADAQPCGGGWQSMIQKALRERKLAVLTSLFSGSWDYVPDFITPQPYVPEPTLHEDLHAIANVDAGRLRWEIEIMALGNPEDNLSGRRIPRVLKDVLQQGEQALAQRLADELDQVWQQAIAPHWATLRARLESDIGHRARAIARHGLSGMLADLHPRVVWDDDHLKLLTRLQGRRLADSGLTLMPSAITTNLFLVMDCTPAPVPRPPIITYPALRSAATGPSAAPTTQALFGMTRARLLADLQVERTTGELGERHFLAASTVSYHLGILHRAGLVTRTRKSHRVLYEQTPGATALLGSGTP